MYFFLLFSCSGGVEGFLFVLSSTTRNFVLLALDNVLHRHLPCLQNLTRTSIGYGDLFKIPPWKCHLYSFLSFIVLKDKFRLSKFVAH
jgi:hypothetical protein